jgi:hypothetical protein
MDDRVSIPGRAWNFSLHHRVQTGSGARPASYPMGTGGSFPGRRVVKLTAHLHLEFRLRMYAAIPPFPHTCSWRGTFLPVPYL